jgi:CheY-like chemotaxis protein
MRLDFNVLWIENQQDSVQSQKERLEHLIRQEGFRLRVTFASSVEDALKYLAEDIYTDHVDLILMDYDLGPGMKGNEGLVEVRHKVPYRDIVFYSSQAGDLLDMVLKAKVQGIYCSTRQELPDTAIGVFGILVKKVIDIDHARGIVMGATSDIDHYIMDCLVTSFGGSRKNSSHNAGSGAY